MNVKVEKVTSSSFLKFHSTDYVTYYNIMPLINPHYAAHDITQPPKNTTTALGTNATFSCAGFGGSLVWEIANAQVQSPSQVQLFAAVEVYVPLPARNFSELIMTGTQGNNVTRSIRCHVFPDSLLLPLVTSDVVHLLVLGT